MARRDLWDLLFRLSAQGVTLLVTTHYMDEAERCARVGYLHLGHLLAVGTPQDLRTLPDVTPEGTHRLEITLGSRRPDRHRVSEGAAVAALLEDLRKRPGVRQATIFGQAVRALIDADRTPADLGLEDAEVRPAEAGLEDVFVALSRAQTEKANGERGV